MQALAHVRRFLTQLDQGRLRADHVLGQAQRRDDGLDRALDLLERRLFEEVRVEERAEDGLDLVVGVFEDAGQVVDRLRIPGRLDVPGRHLRLVGDEEGVEVASE